MSDTTDHDHDAHDHDAHDHAQQAAATGGHGAHSHPGLSVAVERTGPCLATVRFEVTPEEFQRTRARGLQNVSRNTRMKGFRPGKTPRKVVEKQFGPQIELEAKKHFLNDAYNHAVRDNELRPASHPRVDLADIRIGEDGGLKHEFEVLLRPDVELGEYKGVSVESRPTTVDDDEVAGAVEDLRRHQARPERTETEPLQADGMALCKVTFLAEDGSTELLERDGIRMSPKTVPTGVDPEAFEKAMIGAKEGEEVDVEITFPDEFPNEAARGATGTCRVALEEVYRVVTPSDEELFRTFEVEDMDGLRAALRERIEEHKASNERHRVENEILDRVLESHPMEIPEALVDDQADAKVAELRSQLEEEGLDPEELEQRLAEERQRAFAASHRAMRAIYLMEEIAKAEGIQVREEDLLDELREIASRNRTEVDEVRKYYREQGLLQQLALELLERKVRSFLRESADIRSAS